MTKRNYSTRKRFDLVSDKASNPYSSKTDSEIMQGIFIWIKREGAELLLRNLVLFGTEGVLLSSHLTKILLFMDYLQRDDLNKVLKLIMELKTQRIALTPISAPLPKRC